MLDSIQPPSIVFRTQTNRQLRVDWAAEFLLVVLERLGAALQEHCAGKRTTGFAGLDLVVMQVRGDGGGQSATRSFSTPGMCGRRVCVASITTMSVRSLPPASDWPTNSTTLSGTGRWTRGRAGCSSAPPPRRCSGWRRWRRPRPRCVASSAMLLLLVLLRRPVHPFHTHSF